MESSRKERKIVTVLFVGATRYIREGEALPAASA